MAPHRYGEGAGGKGADSWCSPAAACLPGCQQTCGFPSGQRPDTPRSTLLVQNPYVRMPFVQAVYNGLQRAEGLGGYLCLDQHAVVAAWCLPVAWRGIQSSGVCHQLAYSCHQGVGAGCDTLGSVKRQQDFETVFNLFCA